MPNFTIDWRGKCFGDEAVRWFLLPTVSLYISFDHWNVIIDFLAIELCIWNEREEEEECDSFTDSCE